MGLDQSVSEGRKRWILSIRTTADGRQRVVSAADANGRSLSEEIEGRLQKSFYRDDSLGGFANAAFVDLLGAIIRDIEAAKGESWASDHGTWSAVRERIVSELDSRQPPKKSVRLRASKVQSKSAKGGRS